MRRHGCKRQLHADNDAALSLAIGAAQRAVRRQSPEDAFVSNLTRYGSGDVAMQQQHSFEAILETSRRVNWRIEDISADKKLDFTRPFLPETFARTKRLVFLTPDERLALNHIRARGYLATFELVERFITPFVAEQAGLGSDEEPFRAAALEQFASEETKHMELFRRFLSEFDEAFGIKCDLIGPPEAIASAILAHSPLSVAIATLGIEWMSQGHYAESVKDDHGLDLQFKSLLKHHWIEEAQHAKLDALLVRDMARRCTPGEIDRAIDEYFGIGVFFDAGFKQQAALDLDAFERATDRSLTPEERTQFLDVQHQALRWTFLGSAMSNRNFLAALAPLGESARTRIGDASAAFI
jgi:hypothetical protein